MSKNFLSKFKWFILGTIVTFSGIAFAAAQPSFTPSLLPLTTDTYYLGSTSPNLEWNGLYVKNINISGTCTGSGCGSGGGGGIGDPFTHPFLNYSATTSAMVIGTSTPSFGQLTLGSSTAPQLVIADDMGTASWTFRDAGNNLYIATTTVAGTATTTLPALTILGASGNVGIGTTSPNAKLKIESTTPGAYDGVTFQQLSPTGLGYFSVSNSVGNDATFFVGSPSQTLRNPYGLGSGAIADLTVNGFNSFSMGTFNAAPVVIGTSNTERFRITSAGNVGIGTTTPTSKLRVETTTGAAYDGVTVQQLSPTGIGQADVSNSAGNDIGIFSGSASQTIRNVYGMGTGANGDISSNGLNNFAIGTFNSAPLIFGTTNTERMRISSTGNVGIGSTTPTAQLGISGVAGQTSFAIGSSTGTQFIVDKNGNVGIGTAAPLNNLDVSGGANSGTLAVRTTGTTGQTATLSLISGFSGTNGNASISAGSAILTLDPGTVGGTNRATIFNIGGGEVMRITSTGNIGIGTTSPAAKLTVASVSTGDDTPAFIVDGALTSNGNADMALNANSSGTAEANIDFNRAGATQWQLGLQNGGGATGNDFELWDGSNNPVFTINHNTLDTNIGTTTCGGLSELCVWGDGGASGNIFQVTTVASSSALSISNTGFATTTLSGLNISGSATSTSNMGFNITNGCYAVGGVCLVGSTGLTSYDAWTHPSAGISATTSQVTVAGLLSTASTTIVGNATTTGTFSIGNNVYFGTPKSEGSILWNKSGNFLGIYDAVNNNEYYGLAPALPGPAGTVALGGFYNGMGLQGSSANTGVPLFAVLSSTDNGNSNAGIGHNAFTIRDDHTMYTFSSTLDNGSGKMGIKDSNPNATLSVVGNAAIGYASNQASVINGLIVNGNIGAGTSTPTAQFSIDNASSTAGTSQTTPFGDLLGMVINGIKYMVSSYDYFGVHYTSGPTPTVTSCGTSPTVTGNTQSFQVTVGSVAATGCVIAFPYPLLNANYSIGLTNEQMSVVNALTISSKSATGFTVSQTGLTGDVLDITISPTR